MADRREVVELVRVAHLDRTDERGRISQVALDQGHERELPLNGLLPRVVLPANQTEHLVPLGMEEIRDVSAILAGNSRNQCPTRFSHSSSPEFQSLLLVFEWHPDELFEIVPVAEVARALPAEQ